MQAALNQDKEIMGLLHLKLKVDKAVRKTVS